VPSEGVDIPFLLALKIFDPVCVLRPSAGYKKTYHCMYFQRGRSSFISYINLDSTKFVPVKKDAKQNVSFLVIDI
jgi:hypothetical protein